MRGAVRRSFHTSKEVLNRKNSKKREGKTHEFPYLKGSFKSGLPDDETEQVNMFPYLKGSFKSRLVGKILSARKGVSIPQRKF